MPNNKSFSFMGMLIFFIGGFFLLLSDVPSFLGTSSNINVLYAALGFVSVLAVLKWLV